MTLSDLQQWVCDQLAADAWLSERHVAFIPENKGDPASEIERALAAAGLAGIVMTPGFRADAQEDFACNGVATVAVQIAEIPPTNRAQSSYCTALDAAERVAQIVLSWPGARVTAIRMIDAGEGAVAYETSLDIAAALPASTVS